MTRPTSIRIRPKALAVLDAWADLIAAERGSVRSRGDAIDALVAAARPPEQLTPEARAVREALKAARP